MHLQHLSPSREGGHQERALSKDRVQRDHSREDPRNRTRALLGKGQGQGKDLLVRDPGKVRGRQVKGPNQVKGPLGRPPGKVKDHQVRGPNRAMALLVKGLLGKAPDKVKDHQAKALQGSKHQNQVKDHKGKGPNRVAPLSRKAAHPNKDQGNLDPNSKGRKVLGLSLVSRELGNLQVDSVPCVRPPS